MAVAEVQTAGAHNTNTVVLGGNVTAGNSVLVSLVAFNNSGSAISSSAPTFGGSSVSGAALLVSNQSGAANPNIFAAVWLLPNLAGGSATIATSYTNGFASHTIATEFSGLSASPVAGPVNSGAAIGTSGTSSGTLSALSQQAAVVGVAGAGGNMTGAPSSPWTSTLDGNDCWGWQVGNNGDTPVFTPSMSGATNWAAAIAAVYPGGTTVSLPVAAVTLAAPLVDPQVTVPLPAAAVALAAPVVAVQFGAATISLPAAALALSAPLISLPGGGSEDDPPWHIRKRRR